MRNQKARRFGAHEVLEGPHKGRLHVPTTRYIRFLGELHLLCSYLDARLLPTEPEEAAVVRILMNLQNILEHEAELAIVVQVPQIGTQTAKNLVARMRRGYVSFKSKCDWLLKHSLVSKQEWVIMEEVRRLRNAVVHVRPSTNRPRHTYRKKALLTRDALRLLLVDTEQVLRSLRTKSGSKCKWATVPPGYASEMGWPERDIALFDGCQSLGRSTP